MFAWLAAVARAPGVTHFGAHLALLLSSYFSKGRREAWPKQTTLAAILRATPEGVRKGIIQLRDAGFLTIRPGRGRGQLNVYAMAMPAQKTPTLVGVESPTGVGQYEQEGPTGGGVSEQKTPTPVGEKPQPRLVHVTKEAEPRNLSPVKRESASRRKPETALPPNFPDAELIAQAQSRLDEAAHPEISAPREAAKFRDRNTATGSRYRSWPGAWSTWIGNAIEWAEKAARAAPARPRSRLEIELDNLTRSTT